jgi:hypothetical protein
VKKAICPKASVIMMKCTPEVRIAIAPVAARSRGRGHRGTAARSRIHDARIVQDHHRIGAEADHRGVADRDQPRAAHQQRQRDGGHGQDHRARQQRRTRSPRRSR